MKSKPKVTTSKKRIPAATKRAASPAQLAAREKFIEAARNRRGARK